MGTIQHFLKRTSPDRLDRVEASLVEVNAMITRMAQEQESLRRYMCAAIMAHQEQSAENSRLLAEITKSAAKLRRTRQ